MTRMEVGLEAFVGYPAVSMGVEEQAGDWGVGQDEECTVVEILENLGE